MKKKIYLFALLSLTLFSSCKKKTYGNTDTETNTYSVSWTWEDPSYTCTISDPAITQEVVDKGAVLVYISNGNGGWVALPCTIPIDGTYSSTYTPTHYVGGVKIWKTDTDLLTLDPGTSSIKLVILSQHALLENPNVDWTDYKEVEEAVAL